MIPEMTRVALIARRNEIVAELRTSAHDSSGTIYHGRTIRRNGAGRISVRALERACWRFSWFMPKVGPFKALDFKIPTQQTEDLYIASVDRTVEDYTKLLHEVADGKLQLENTDFDTGRATRAGEYGLSDKTYARLLDQLAGHNFDQISPGLRSNILAFYSDPNGPLATKTTPDDQKKKLDELEKLRALPESAPGGKATSDIRSETAGPTLKPPGSLRGLSRS